MDNGYPSFDNATWAVTNGRVLGQQPTGNNLSDNSQIAK